MKKIICCMMVVFWCYSPAVFAQEAEAETAEVKEVTPVTSVVAASVCREIVSNEPVEPGTAFTNDVGKVYCYSKISATAETEVWHKWSLNGEEIASVPLPIGKSSGWRTFSSKNIRQIDTGSWKVTITDAESKILQELEFTVN